LFDYSIEQGNFSKFFDCDRFLYVSWIKGFVVIANSRTITYFYL